MDSFVFLGFGIDAWITLVTVFAMFFPIILAANILIVNLVYPLTPLP